MSNPFRAILANILATEPKSVNGQDNISSRYYRNWCIRKIFARYEITGMPTWWDRSYVYEHLFLDGYIGITSTPELGVLPLKCSFTGYNVFEKPTELLFANSVLGDFTRRINFDAVLVKMDDLYNSYRPMIARYAYLLAAADSGIDVNLMNCKVTDIYRATTASEAKEIKAAVDKINKGEPAIYVSGKVPVEPYTRPVKNYYVADIIQQTKREIMNEFYSELDVNNANTLKKERMITDEVNANNEQIHIDVAEVLVCVEEGLEKANEMFGLDLHIRLRDLGGEKDVGRETTGTSGMESQSI